jgi:hypothetical protein
VKNLAQFKTYVPIGTNVKWSHRGCDGQGMEIAARLEKVGNAYTVLVDRSEGTAPPGIPTYR